MRKRIKDYILKFRVIIEKDEPSGYHGYVPALRGVHTQGETIDEVRKNLKEAIICHLQGLLKDKEEIPEDKDSFEFIEIIPLKDLAKR